MGFDILWGMKIEARNGDIEILNHTIHWPILSGIEYRIVCKFGDPNYSDPECKDWHHGIDIQVDSGTKADHLFLDPKSSVYLKAGEYIGKVGTWPYILGKNIKVKPDVKKLFGNNFHHLHFKTTLTHHQPGTLEFLWEINNDKNLLDPLYLLE